MKTTRPEIDIDAVIETVEKQTKSLTESERVALMDEILTCRPGGIIRCGNSQGIARNAEGGTIGMFPNLETGMDNTMLGMSVIAGMIND